MADPVEYDAQGKPIPAAPSSAHAVEYDASGKPIGAPATSSPSMMDSLFGKNPISDTVNTVGSHLKNLVAAPYHAFTDDPRDPKEAAMVNANGGMNTAPTSALSGPAHVNPIVSGLNRIGLGVDRMLVQPTQQGIQTFNEQRKAGNTSLSAPEYDTEGNYTPTAVSGLMDAVPLAGPMARSFANDAHQHGVIPAALGAGTDFLGTKAIGKVGGAALRGTGLAGQVASATPESMKVAATRGLVIGTPEELLNRALKPSVSYPDFEESTGAALPTINRMNPAPGVRGFSDAVNQAKQDVHQQYQGMKAPVSNAPIDTTPLVRKQIDSIPATERFENPGIIGSTARQASAYDMTPQTHTVTSPLLDQYGKPIQSTVTTTPTQPDLNTVDAIRRDTNAKLTQKVFESPNKNTALANPETARLNAVNTGTRDLVYKKIADANNIPESDVRANQDLYGHLSDIGDVAGKRATVAGRANPVSLQESMGFNHGNPISGVYNFATQRLLRNLTDSDAITDAAMDRYRNPDGITLTPRSGAIPKIGSAVGQGVQAAGKGIFDAPLKYNPLFYNPRQDRQ